MVLAVMMHSLCQHGSSSAGGNVVGCSKSVAVETNLSVRIRVIAVITDGFQVFSCFCF